MDWGDCLPGCPTGAISFEVREAPAYDEIAVLASKVKRVEPIPCGCAGMEVQTFEDRDSAGPSEVPSRLRQWPVQLQLVPVSAPWFEKADVLIAADCTAYAYGNFHQDFIRGHVTLIGCPKLDSIDYSEKLTAILAHNNIHSLTLTRMMVPCCGGMEMAVKKAMAGCGKQIPLRIVTIDADGRVLKDQMESSAVNG